MFYAHKPWSPAVSPKYPDEPRAHTSVLLCNVKENKIQNLLNIDGYNYTSYVDILGERLGGKPHPYIQQRLVLKALDNTRQKMPIQKPSWSNMNCVLYSFSYVEQIIRLFNTQPELMENLFLNEMDDNPVSPVSLFLLEEGILEGLTGKYIRKDRGNFVSDEQLTREYHANIRTAFAEQYRLEHTIRLPVDAEETTRPEIPVSGTSAISHEETEVKFSSDAKHPHHVLSADSHFPKPSPSLFTTAMEDNISDKENSVKQQSRAARQAVYHGKPHATEGLISRFVNTITRLWERIKNAVQSAVRNIGFGF